MKRIWKKNITTAHLNATRPPLHEFLDFKVTEIGADYLVGTMPVNEHSHQPYGLLHGGASCVAAEALGSWAAILASDEGYSAVGTDLNASHLRGEKTGLLKLTARPLKIGRRMQFWQINIENEAGKLVCATRLTTAIIPIK